MARTSIQQLAEIRSSLSSRHVRSTSSGEQFQNPVSSIPDLTPKSKSWWNVFQWFTQNKNEGRVETGLHTDRLKTFEQIEHYGNDVSARSAKHAIDCEKVASDDAVVKRGADYIVKSGVSLFVRVGDALQVSAEIADQKVTSAEAIKDPEIRAKHIQEIRLVHARQATDIRAAAYGYKYDLQRNREEDA